MTKSRRILVTGGSGLVGANLKAVVETEYSAKENFIFLSSRDCNLEDPNETRNIFEEYRPDCVLHLAANVGGLFKNMRENYNIFRSNMTINDNVYNCAIEFGVKKCVSCLSTCVFPDKTEYPIDETMIHNGPPNDTNYGYSYAKRYMDIYNRAINEKFPDLIFTSIVPCNIYGIHDNFNLENGHVIPSLMHKAYIAKKNNQPLTVFGSGRPLRQFIYGKDLARLILRILNEYTDRESIILSTDESDEISIADAAESIRKAFKIEQDLVFDASYADGQFKKTATNRKMRSLWPDFKFTPFDVGLMFIYKGINETVNWFIEHYDTARK